MALWFALSLMTIGAVFAVLWPLARKPERVEGANDLAVYRDQLEEVRRDRAAQSIGEKEAAAAEVEISRRLIAAPRPRPLSAGPSCTTMPGNIARSLKKGQKIWAFRDIYGAKRLPPQRPCTTYAP